MAKVDIRALKQNASAVVAEAAAGKVVVITDRGRPVAQLTPIPSSRVAQFVEAGSARPAKRPLSELRAPEPGPELSKELLEAREDERH